MLYITLPWCVDSTWKDSITSNAFCYIVGTADSAAMDFVRPITAAFDVEYAQRSGTPFEEVLKDICK